MTITESTTPMTPHKAGRLARAAAYSSVAVALFLIVIKLFALVATGSVAMLGSLIDSALDALASVLNAFAIHQASQPADREHRFGHGKAEAIAGLGQAVFISGSALFLAFQSITRLAKPEPLGESMVGVVVILISMAATVALVLFQRFVVRRTKSLAVTADSLHYRGDLFMNAAVIAALLLGGLPGMARVDAVFGLAIAGYIGYGAWAIVRLSFDQLMDHELDDDARARIKEIVKRHPEVRSMHDLRTRLSGFDTFIQLHLELDPKMPLARAHAVADEVEAALMEAFPGAQVLIHEDPAGQENVPAEPYRAAH